MLTSYELDPVNQGMPAPSKYIHVNDDEDGDDNVDDDDDDDNELDPVNQDMLAPVKHIHAIGIIINNIECEAVENTIFFQNPLYNHLGRLCSCQCHLHSDILTFLLDIKCKIHCLVSRMSRL